MTMSATTWTPLGLLIMVLFSIFVIASLIWLVLLVARTQARPSAPHDAIAILEQRLARGEIGVDDYRARRTAIEAPR